VIAYDPLYLLFLAPALGLGYWAQHKVRLTYAMAEREPARLSGAAAARSILEAAHVTHVGIEQVPGRFSDHYDPRSKVLRLSADVYHGQNLAGVGIAAHEAGHAIQDHQGYWPLVVRDAAVPAASFGSQAGLTLIILGTFIPGMAYLGIGLYLLVALFQVVNLPVEFDASRRARRLLLEQGIVSQDALPVISRVLRAAALTYVAATLQAILTIAYLAYRVMGRRSAR
jgi:hypothetical protein